MKQFQKSFLLTSSEVELMETTSTKTSSPGPVLLTSSEVELMETFGCLLYLQVALLTSSEVELMETVRYLRTCLVSPSNPRLLTSSEVELMETSIHSRPPSHTFYLLTSSEVELMETISG